jgi:uncharacterized protein
MNVTGLWIYPIKSCRGIAVDALHLDDRGPQLDRRWMLVDDENRFMSQRENPRMALIDVGVDSDEICVSAPGMSLHTFSIETSWDDADDCVIWKDKVALHHVDSDIDRWFSDFLGTSCRLMRMPTTTKRVVDRTYSPQTRLVTLADAFPMLLIGTASLALLNQKLTARHEDEIPMERFRPNVVIKTDVAHAEDEWKSIRIGSVACSVVKPCARCTVPTVDIRTGVASKEPLLTLSEYRKDGSKVYFGQNVIHETRGTINMGATVSVDA